MAATAKKKTEGILRKPLSDRYQVKFTKGGKLHYGIIRQPLTGKSKGDKEILMYAATGKVLVDDAILPICHAVPEGDLTDVPVGTYPDELTKFVDAAAEVARKASDALRGIAVGKLFFVHVNDGQACYEITAVKGSKVDVEWRGYGGGDRYTDHYFGWGRKGVAVSDVKRYVQQADFFNELAQQKDDFYSTLKVGQTLHYHNGHGAYVRCEVVEGEEGLVLRPVALVGIWSKSDIFSVSSTGTVHHGYHAKHVLGVEVEGSKRDWRPSEGCIYENTGKFSGPGPWKGGDYTTMPNVPANTIDPRKLEPLPLHPPATTPEQEAQYKAWQALEEVKGVLDPKERPEGLDSKDPYAMRVEAEQRMAKAYKLIRDYLKDLPISKTE